MTTSTMKRLASILSLSACAGLGCVEMEVPEQEQGQEETELAGEGGGGVMPPEVAAEEDEVALRRHVAAGDAETPVAAPDRADGVTFCVYTLAAATAAIDAKYSSLGGSAGVLGAASGGVYEVPGKNGFYRHYKGKYNQGASIYWSCPTGARFVMGSIRSRWSALGWETGVMGFPTTDELTTPDGVGRYNHFQGGSIYWKPTLGAHGVWGLIRSLWAQGGWELGPLGYPRSSEQPTKTGSQNRFNDFENGVIYWKYGQSAAVKPAANPLCSKSYADMKVTLDKEIDKKLAEAGGLYRTGTSTFAVTDYSISSIASHNRMYKVTVEIAGDVPIFADPDIKLSLWVELDGERPSQKVRYRLTGWYAHVTVYNCVLGICPITVDDVLDRLHDELDPMLNDWTYVTDSSGAVMTIPPSLFTLLNLKTQANGNLDCFAVGGI